ncbi:hypothetical protein N0V88_005506 [Collariella sp. IMI 366227]|nr:hypothetical protein N0V88_005506 [Collariella sp. IMI 366227]
MSQHMVHLPGAHDPSLPVVFATAGPLEADDDIDMENDDSGIDADGSEYSSTSILDGKLYLAPLDGSIVRRALDIGTGFGHWAIEFADLHPNIEVIGTDLSPMQSCWVPSNLSFQLDDATRPWTFENESVDYVHMRYLYGSIPDWDELFRQAYQVLKPGGYVETFETEALFFAEDGSMEENLALNLWGEMFEVAGRRMGRSFHVLTEDLQRKGLEAAGFEDLVQQDFKVGLVMFILHEVMEVPWDFSQINAYIEDLEKALRDERIHAQ